MDSVLVKVPNKMLDLSKLEISYCHECKKEVDNTNFYHYDNSLLMSTLSFCPECFDNSVLSPQSTRGAPPTFLEKSKASPRECVICCELLNQPDVCPDGYCWSHGYFEVCPDCLPEVKKMFVHICPETRHELIYTSRDRIFRCVNPPPDQLEIPAELSDRITEKLQEMYALCLNSIVQFPFPDWNAGEWALIDDFHEVPSFPASCSFAVRCIKGQHQIASVVEDDHGRIAMNVVFDNVSEFLEEEREWLQSILPEEERQQILGKVSDNFYDEGSCDEDLMMEAVDNFPVYLRLKHRLDMYYG